MFAFILCFILLSLSVFTAFTVSEENTEMVVNDENNDFSVLPVTENYGETEQFSSKYDPRDSGIITSVKNQNPFSLCWMYATAATFEAYVSKNYGSLYDISEFHGAIIGRGNYSGEGYLTETLKMPYKFNSNKKCAVFLEVIPNSSNSKVYLPCENFTSFINRGESFYCIDPVNGAIQWNDVIDKNDYNISGSFCIRPVLHKQSNDHYSEISINEIINTEKDCELEYNSDSYLFNIHTSTNVLLRENRDYIKADNKIILKSSYLKGLKDKYTEIVLEFNNDITKTIVVNPKAKIMGVQVNGTYAVGETLTANIVTDIIKENYDVEYQWQSSLNGVDWYDISNANENKYTISENDFFRYIRVVVKSSSKYGNVIYPSTVTSETSKTKCIIFGDTDLDGYVNIDDATRIQKYLVYLTEFNNEQKMVADFDRDGEVSINDVTAIQKMLVK